MGPCRHFNSFTYVYVSDTSLRHHAVSAICIMIRVSGVSIAEWLASRTSMQLARVQIQVGVMKFSDGTCKYLPCVELLFVCLLFRFVLI